MDNYFGDSFLLACKDAYISGMTPTVKGGYFNKDFPRIVAIASKYFENEAYDDFVGYFQEGQYFISLWAAHLILEYGKPSEELKNEALSIIKEYSSSLLTPKVAELEALWLEKYLEKH